MSQCGIIFLSEWMGGIFIRKVELTMNEQRKYEVIKKLVETNGNKHCIAAKQATNQSADKGVQRRRKSLLYARKSWF